MVNRHHSTTIWKKGGGVAVSQTHMHRSLISPLVWYTCEANIQKQEYVCEANMQNQANDKKTTRQ